MANPIQYNGHGLLMEGVKAAVETQEKEPQLAKDAGRFPRGVAFALRLED